MRRLLPLLFLLTGCTSAGSLAWQSIDQAGRYSAKEVVVDDIQVPDGYRVVRVVNGLNFPSAFTWDGEGNLYVLESHTLPVPMLKPKIVRVRKGGAIDRVALSGPNAPDGGTAIGLTFHDGWLYFSAERKNGTFDIDRVRPSGGAVETVVSGMPVQGDHDVNHIVFGNDGAMYFGVGSATNSGYVTDGDPVNAKWLKAHPEGHDIPCKDLTLTGITKNDGTATTGAFQQHGQSAAKTVSGTVPCTSAVYRLNNGARTPEVVAWGFRNPVALAFDGDTLFVGMQGADVRSSRPISGDTDSVLRIREGAWYGWPDYGANLAPWSDFVIDHGASNLQPPDRSLVVATTKPHAAISGMSVWNGALLVAEMGDFKPMTEPTDKSHAGFQVERVDLRTGAIAPLFRNKGSGDAAPASELDLRNGFERPVDVRVGPDGNVYVLDYGAFVTTSNPPKAMPKTGKVFRIEPVR